MGGVGEVQDRTSLAGGDGHEHIAVVQLLLEEPDVLPSEDHGDLLGIPPAVLRELPHGHGDAGVVAVALRDDTAGPDHEEAVLRGLLQVGAHDG